VRRKGFGATTEGLVTFDLRPQCPIFHRFWSLKPPNLNVRPLYVDHGASGQALRRAIAWAICPQELVSMNPSDLCCAGKCAPCKRAFLAFFLAVQKNLNVGRASVCHRAAGRALSRAITEVACLHETAPGINLLGSPLEVLPVQGRGRRVYQLSLGCQTTHYGI